MNLFDNLFDKAESKDSLDTFLKENMLSINDFYNSDFSKMKECKSTIDKFILLKYQLIEELDFTKFYNRSFVIILFDFCERFNLRSSTQRIVSILLQNDLYIGYRLQAALLFLSNIDANSRLIERYDKICSLIQAAIDQEEDSEEDSISTFLNYYRLVVQSTPLQYANQLKQKINDCINDEKYKFLSCDKVQEILLFDLTEKGVYDKIQFVIDSILSKKSKTEEEIADSSLVEEESDYVSLLSSVESSFDAIRSISTKLSDGSALTDRGVKILETEGELLAYMRRSGNMHKAKLDSAFEFLVDHINSKFTIYDWGCGQGIASMALLEKIDSDLVNCVYLIEPSKLSLKRAALHVSKFNNAIPIRTICKKMDDLTVDDVRNVMEETTVHLFSNILDISDYSQKKLINLIEKSQKNRNYFLCVSPCIDDVKTARIDSFKCYFEKKNSFFLLGEETNPKKGIYWNCNNHYRGNGFCLDHLEKVNGYCANKWSRLIRVFVVDL